MGNTTVCYSFLRTYCRIKASHSFCDQSVDVWLNLVRSIMTFCVVILYLFQVTKNWYFTAQILSTNLTLLCIRILKSADQTVLCAHCVVRWVSKANMWLWQHWQVKNTFKAATHGILQYLAYRSIIDLHLKIMIIWKSRVFGYSHPYSSI